MSTSIRLKYLCTSFSTPITQNEVSETGLYPVFGASGLVGYRQEYSCEYEYLGIVKDGAGVGRVNQFTAKSSLLGTMAYIIPASRVDIRWLKYAIIGLELGKDISSTTIPHIYFNEYGNRYVAHICFAEQRRIADFLDRRCAEIDGVIEATKKTIEEYKALKQSIITEAVTGQCAIGNVQGAMGGKRRMKDSGIEWIGEIPEEWEIVRLKNLFDFGKGLPITKENLIESGIPVISYGQIHSKITTGVELQQHLYRYVDAAYVESNPQSLVHKGDFIFADTSEDLDGCGNAVYIDNELTLFAGYHTIVFSSKGEKNNKFLAYLFRTDAWRSQIRSKVSGVKVLSISRRILADATVVIPNIDEREAIVAYLDDKCKEINRIIERKQELLTEFEMYRKSVIYEYVTGKREVF